MNVSIMAAFGGGLLSFLSPCVLPLMPVYISFVTGYSIQELKEGDATPVRILIPTLAFVLGFSLVFTALGASATLIGELLNRYLNILAKILGVLVIILGLHMTGLFRLPFLQKHLQFKEVKTPKGILGPFVLGMAFALGWSPCTGPILASILAYASTQQHIAKGVLLLAVYSSGLAVPFLLFALLSGYAMKALQRFQRLFRTVEIASGLVLIALGIFMLKGSFFSILV